MTINVGKEYTVSTDKTKFHPKFYDILGEKVIVTGDWHLGKYPVEFVDNPNLNTVAQRVRGDLLMEV